ACPGCGSRLESGRDCGESPGPQVWSVEIRCNANCEGIFGFANCFFSDRLRAAAPTPAWNVRDRSIRDWVGWSDVFDNRLGAGQRVWLERGFSKLEVSAAA